MARDLMQTIQTECGHHIDERAWPASLGDDGCWANAWRSFLKAALNLNEPGRSVIFEN